MFFVAILLLFLRVTATFGLTTYSINVSRKLKYILFLLFFVNLYYFYKLFSFYTDIIFFNIGKPQTYNVAPFLDTYYFIFCIKNYFSVENIDFFGYVILFLAYTIGFLCIVCLNSRYYYNTENMYILFILFLVVVFMLVTTHNYIVWIISYELLMLPSFLVIYYVSVTRRAVQASLYFLGWTQFGSLIVICCITYMAVYSGVYTFIELWDVNFSNLEFQLLYFFFFLGFGIKVPIWPFHFWLTKTHVEASAGFSMYLSGFLVKTAVLGFYRFTSVLNFDVNTSIYITICVVGIFDASFKMWCQSDLKKLVAYCTIQEMNFIYLVFCWGDTALVPGGVYFMLAHGFLSSLMFFLVDCVQQRFGTRNVVGLSGIINVTPGLGASIFFMCIMYAGLPTTVKFFAEYMILSKLFLTAPVLTVLILIANFVALIGFCKTWFNVIFGLSPQYTYFEVQDLTLFEYFIIIFCFFFSIVFISIPIFFY